MVAIQDNERLYFLKLNFRDKKRCHRGFKILSDLHFKEYSRFETVEFISSSNDADTLQRQSDIRCFLGYYNALMLSIMFDPSISELPDEIIIEIRQVFENPLANLYINTKQYSSLPSILWRYINGEKYFAQIEFKNSTLVDSIDEFLMLYRTRLDDQLIDEVIALADEKKRHASALRDTQWSDILEVLGNEELLLTHYSEKSERIADILNGIGKLLNYLVDYTSLLKQLNVNQATRAWFWHLDKDLFYQVKGNLGNSLILAVEKLKFGIIIGNSKKHRSEEILLLTDATSIPLNTLDNAIKSIRYICDFGGSVNMDNQNMELRPMTSKDLDSQVRKIRVEIPGINLVGYAIPLQPTLTQIKKFHEIKILVESLEADAEKFYNKANTAAGTRIRKGMQDLKNLAQEIRIEVEEAKARKEKDS